MLKEPNLSLEQAIRLGQSAEETQKHVKALKQDAEISKINHTHISRSYSPNQNSHSASNPKSKPPNNSSTLVIRKCKFCSGTHNKGNCPAYYRNYLKCNRKGHYSSCCNNFSRVHQVKEHAESSTSDCDSEFFVGAIYNENTNNTLVAVKKMHSIGVNNDWTVKFETNGTDVIYKIDSGAQVNVMPESIYKTLKQKSESKPTKVKLTAYNGSQIPVIGQCEGKINYRGKNVNLIFIVSSNKSAPILGLDSSVKLKLIQRVMNITQDDSPNFFAEFNDCFGDIGSLPKIYHILVKPEVTPTISPARRVPIAVRDNLRSELERMIMLDVIEPVREPTEWVNPLVTVEKPNGKLRVCLDPRDLNKAIKRQHYKLPTAEELFSEMTGARYFSKLDASNGHWQIKIDTESSKLLTLVTPFG